jgi:tetratricopeptide (TPR) repeat protein
MESRRGKIVTFYSYKGGTGRSMMLANVAWSLAEAGKSVLVVDWDLEAPGLHRYFAPFLRDPQLRSSDGIIDMVICYSTAVLGSKAEDSADPAWMAKQANILRYAVSLRRDDWWMQQGSIDFVGAGRQGPSYGTRVNTFDWRSFYERYDGKAFFDAVRDSMCREYDYVFVDSRTGVSDTSGICTIQLPDILVPCFTMNNQSMEGIGGVLGSVLAQRSGTLPEIYPVPMRIDTSEKQKLDSRMDYAQSRFGQFPARLSGPERRRYWGEIAVPYVPYYAYEELLAAFADRPERSSSILASTLRLASYIVEEPIAGGVVPESQRRQVLAEYAQRTAQPVAESEIAQAAESAWERLAVEERERTLVELSRLVRIAPEAEGGGKSRLSTARQDLDLSPHALQVLTAAGVLLVSTDASIDTVELAQDALLSDWPRLTAFLDSERAFLVWRAHLKALMTDWVLHPADPEALLTGPSLADAERWLAERPAYLSAKESAFIQASLRAKKKRRARLYASAGVTLALLTVLFGTFLWQRQKAESAQSALLILDRAESAVEAGNDSLAYDLFNRYSAAAPRAPEGYAGRAAIEARWGQYGAAVRSYSAAVSHSPNPAYLVGRGDAYSRLNRPREAIADYERALATAQSASTYDAKGQAQAALGDTAAALRSYSQALTLDSTYAQAAFDRGVLHAARGRKLAAIEDFRTASQTTSDVVLAIAAQSRIAALEGPSQISKPVVPPRSRASVVVNYTRIDDRSAALSVASQLRAAGFNAHVGLELDGIGSGFVVYADRRLAGSAARVGELTSRSLASRGVVTQLDLRRMSAMQDSSDIAVLLPRLGADAVQNAE